MMKGDGGGGGGVVGRVNGEEEEDDEEEHHEFVDQSYRQESKPKSTTKWIIITIM